MKIAVAYFGLPRCSEVSWPTIQDKLLAHLPSDSEVRQFYHFYQQDKVVNPRSGENATLDQANYAPFMTFEGKLETPESKLPTLPFEAAKTHGDAWGDGFNSLRNLLLQLGSLKEVTALVERWAPDVVLFARPDLAYHDAVPALVYHVCAEDPHAVFVPNWQWGKGLNDTFAVCGRDAYLAWGNRLDVALQYCQEQKDVLHSERLLKYAVLKAGGRVYHLDAKASRVRVGGAFAKENYASHQSTLGVLTNSQKRFIFITKWRTRWKLRQARRRHSEGT
jgi:hypothetical protein